MGHASHVCLADLIKRVNVSCHLKDNGEDFALYPSDVLDDVCVSDGDHAAPPSAPPADDSPSPGFSADDDASPLEPSPFHSALYMPQDEMPIPPDFQLRQSGVPGVGGGLGIWARRTVDVGERFGPYVGEQRACLRDPTQGWEVGETLAVYCQGILFSLFSVTE
uniref:MDS1 and EVI1 complex locus n=1 Tax=Hucho hucho TaxID=62062 RepID=A0A4W5JXP1_9TELE